jgi:hypothetical protein
VFLPFVSTSFHPFLINPKHPLGIPMIHLALRAGFAMIRKQDILPGIGHS